MREDTMAEGFLTSNSSDTTWIKPFGRGWKEVTYAAVDGLAVFEGCIILGTVAETQAVKTVRGKQSRHQDGGRRIIRHRNRRQAIPMEEQYTSV